MHVPIVTPGFVLSNQASPITLPITPPMTQPITPPITPPCRLGLLSDAPIDLCGNPLDALSAHLQERLRYAPEERDAVYLYHSIGVEWANGSKVRQNFIPLSGISFQQLHSTVGALNLRHSNLASKYEKR